MLLLNLVTSKGDACHLQLRRLARSGVLWLRNGGEVRSRNFSLPNVGVEVLKPSKFKPAFPCFHLPPPNDKYGLVISIYIYIPRSSWSFLLRVTLKLQSLWPNDRPYITLGLKCAMPLEFQSLVSLQHITFCWEFSFFFFRENPGKPSTQRLRMYEYNTTWAHHERLPKWATSVDDWLQRVPVSWLATNQKPHDVRDTQGNLNPLSHPDTQWVIQY